MDAMSLPNATPLCPLGSILGNAAVSGEDRALTERDEAAREGNAVENPSVLSQAVLRVGASLDLDCKFRRI